MTRARSTEEPCATKGCAVSRTAGIATGGGRSSGQRTPRRTTHLDPKGRGDNSMLIKQGIAEDVYALALQRLNAMVKAALPEPQSPGVERHTRRYHICYRRPREPRVPLSLGVRPGRGPMRNERIEGDEWGTYGVLATFGGDGTRDGLRPARARVTECQ